MRARRRGERGKQGWSGDRVGARVGKVRELRRRGESARRARNPLTSLPRANRRVMGPRAAGGGVVVRGEGPRQQRRGPATPTGPAPAPAPAPCTQLPQPPPPPLSCTGRPGRPRATGAARCKASCRCRAGLLRRLGTGGPRPHAAGAASRAAGRQIFMQSLLLCGCHVRRWRPGTTTCPHCPSMRGVTSACFDVALRRGAVRASLCAAGPRPLSLSPLDENLNSVASQVRKRWRLCLACGALRNKNVQSFP